MAPLNLNKEKHRSYEVTPRLDELSYEILSAILSYLDKEDAKKLRCLNKDFETYMTPQIFHTVLFTPEIAALDAFSNISKSPRLCKLVRTLVLHDPILNVVERGYHRIGDLSNILYERPWFPDGIPDECHRTVMENAIHVLRQGLATMKNVTAITFNSSEESELLGREPSWKDLVDEALGKRKPCRRALTAKERPPPWVHAQSAREMLFALAHAPQGDYDQGTPILPLVSSSFAEAQQNYLVNARELFQGIHRLDLTLDISPTCAYGIVHLDRVGSRHTGDRIREILRGAVQLRVLSLRFTQGSNYDWNDELLESGWLTNHSRYWCVKRLSPNNNIESLLPRYLGENEFSYLTTLDLANIPVWEADLHHFVTSHEKTLTVVHFSYVCLFSGSWQGFFQYLLKNSTHISKFTLENGIDYTGSGAEEEAKFPWNIRQEKARVSWTAELKYTISKSRHIEGRYGPRSTSFVIRLGEEDIQEQKAGEREPIERLEERLEDVD